MRYRELTLELPEIAMDAVTSMLMDLGCLGTVEKPGSIVAYFVEPVDIAMITREIGQVRRALATAGCEANISLASTIVEDQDWNRSWKTGFRPMDIGAHFTVLPPWETPKQGRINLIIDPGMAFGTGHHETTRSCILLIEKYAHSIPRSLFIDLGTGTGLLAIVAYRLGFDRIVAIDTDVLAIEATERNLSLNGIESVEVIPGTLTDFSDRCDMIAANLISGTLVELADALASRLRQGALAVLSGILEGQETEVIAAMESSGLGLKESISDGKWISLVMMRE